jgi:hypothetical protein
MEAKFAWWSDFKLEPVFATVPATSKKIAQFESGQY